jgi:hypothetical protein
MIKQIFLVFLKIDHGFEDVVSARFKQNFVVYLKIDHENFNPPQPSGHRRRH